MESDAEIGPELLQPELSQEACTIAVPSPRGLPWPKGQSGNPEGRPRQPGPSRAHKAAYVDHALFDRRTVELIERAIVGPRRRRDIPIFAFPALSWSSRLRFY